jgi:hypothetical protein
MPKGSKINMSYSHYSLYKECGHRYLLEHILEAPDSIPSIHSYFGEAIHDSLRKGVEHQLNEEERINNFKYVFKKLVMDNLKDYPEFHEMDTFTEQGVEVLKLIPTESLSKKYIFIGAEYVIAENLYKNYYFKGFIDLVLKNKETGKYVIIDWKTSTSAWDVDKKTSNNIFLAQMRFYKYFYSKQKNIPLDDIECKYVVLNRLKDKNNPDAGYGNIQNVEINTDEKSIEEALNDLANTTRDIFIRKIFNKAKLEKRKKACYFCPFKDNLKLCNNNSNQSIEIMKEINSYASNSFFFLNPYNFYRFF